MRTHGEKNFSSSHHWVKLLMLDYVCIYSIKNLVKTLESTLIIPKPKMAESSSSKVRAFFFLSRNKSSAWTL